MYRSGIKKHGCAELHKLYMYAYIGFKWVRTHGRNNRGRMWQLLIPIAILSHRHRMDDSSIRHGITWTVI
jgi:hypothetical protein